MKEDFRALHPGGKLFFPLSPCRLISVGNEDAGSDPGNDSQDTMARRLSFEAIFFPFFPRNRNVPRSDDSRTATIPTGALEVFHEHKTVTSLFVLEEGKPFRHLLLALTKGNPPFLFPPLSPPPLVQSRIRSQEWLWANNGLRSSLAAGAFPPLPFALAQSGVEPWSS